MIMLNHKALLSKYYSLVCFSCRTLAVWWVGLAVGRGILSSPEGTPCIARDIGFAVKKNYCIMRNFLVTFISQIFF